VSFITTGFERLINSYRCCQAEERPAGVILDITGNNFSYVLASVAAIQIICGLLVIPMKETVRKADTAKAAENWPVWVFRSSVREFFT